MNEFERRIDAERRRRQQQVERANTARSQADMEFRRAVAACKVQWVEGIDPPVILGWETLVALDFLEAMQRRGYPNAANLRLTPDRVSREGFLGRVGLGPTVKGQHVKGYMIGQIAPKGQPMSKLYLCDDYRVRTELSGSSPRPIDIDHPETYNVTFGRNVTYSYNTLDIDGDSRPAIVKGVEFTPMPLEKVLTDIALRVT